MIADWFNSLSEGWRIVMGGVVTLGFVGSLVFYMLRDIKARERKQGGRWVVKIPMVWVPYEKEEEE